MNKLVKGAVAGAAGIALLLGGAGTFALWNDAAAVSGGTVSTGTLSIVSTGTATWADISATNVGGATFAPATQKLVPGDTVTFTQRVTVNATGKNLKANLTYLPSSIVVAPALASAVDVTLTATPVAGGNAAVTANGANTYLIAPSGAGGTTSIDVVVTIAFKSTTTGTTGQSVTGGVDLSGLSVTLTQVRP
jgi:alternate signal-mediated exported protein